MQLPLSKLVFWLAFPLLIIFYFIYTLDLHTNFRLIRGFVTRSLSVVFRPPSGSSAYEELYHRAQVDSDREVFVRRIIAVGDLHGDYGNAKKVLHFSGVVDESGNWAGNVNFFVQTGDIIDRGSDTIQLFEWMEKLRHQAKAKGGTVLSLLGNHEWMNAIGNWGDVTSEDIKSFGTVAQRQEIISTGWIGRSWAENYTTSSRLPLHPSIGQPNTPFSPEPKHLHYQKDSDLGLSYYDDAKQPLSHSSLSFVHGGLSPTYENLTPFPTRINELSHSLLKKLQNRKQPPPYRPPEYLEHLSLPRGATKAETQLYGSNGPLWYRGWANDPDDKVCAEVDKVLAKTGTRRMIMGHTVNKKGIVSRCDGKIIIIDTGISHAYGGVLSALSINYTLTPIGSAKDQRWIEREVVSALYPDSRKVLVDKSREIVGDFRVRHQQEQKWYHKLVSMVTPSHT